MGLEHGLFSGARVLGPHLSTYILAAHGVRGVAATCAAIDCALVASLALAPRPVAGASAQEETKEKSS